MERHAEHLRVRPPVRAVRCASGANHERVHQYTGGHDETYGGVTINIDSNAVDGPTFP